MRDEGLNVLRPLRLVAVLLSTAVSNTLTKQIQTDDCHGIRSFEETPKCDTPEPPQSIHHQHKKSHAKSPLPHIHTTIQERYHAPLNQSELDALFPMLDATEWPPTYTERFQREASQDPCRNIIPIRGAQTPSMSNFSFLYNRETVQNRVDTLWKHAVMAGASNLQIAGEAQMTEEALRVGPSVDGTPRSPVSPETCVQKTEHMKEGEGFGGQYLYIRMLVQYAALHNMWYCHHSPKLFGPHTWQSNVSLGDELMGFVAVKSPRGCRPCKAITKLQIEGYFGRRLHSPDKEWLRLDGLLRLRLYSKAAQLQRRGLDLSTCQHKVGRRNVAVHIRRGDIKVQNERYISTNDYIDLMVKLQKVYHRQHDGTDYEGKILFHVYAQIDAKALHKLGPKSQFGQDVILHTVDRDLESFACMITADALLTSLSQFSTTAAEVTTGPSFSWTKQKEKNKRHPNHHDKTPKVLAYPARHFGFRDESDETIRQCLAKRTVDVPLVSYPPPA